MPTFVRMDKCNGCKEYTGAGCMYICPNDLMVLDKNTMKAINQEPEGCWECYSCVKICPQQAIEVRHYADFAPLGGSAIPLQDTNSIKWTLKFRNGITKNFQFITRTTKKGSIDIYKRQKGPGDIDDQCLCTETINDI